MLRRLAGREPRVICSITSTGVAQGLQNTG
jgi:hypothetical protein